MTARIHVGDCRTVLATLPECSVDAVVTDPPYHLTTGKKGGSGPASVNLESPYGRARVTTGFMGMKWDGGDIAHDPALWREVLRVAKPGAHMLAFGGTRTFHRLACAIEDAGWELRDTIGWLFGSGFPKSYNGPWGGTALKPAWEPIILARKPLIATVATNFQAHGTGALNIDGCRVEPSRDDDGRWGNGTRPGGFGNVGADKGSNEPNGRRHEAGRWPANIVHDGSKEVLAVFPDEAGAFAPVRGTEPSRPARNTYGEFTRGGGVFHADSGSAARFFYCAKADRGDRNDGLQFMPQRTTDDGRQTPIDNPFLRGQTERHNDHPTVKPTDLMAYLCRLVTPRGGTILDPFMGSGSTGRGAMIEQFKFIGIELDPRYCDIAEARIRAIAPLLVNVERAA